MEKRTDMRAEALDTLIDIERNKKLSHIAIGETLMRNQFEKKADRAFYTRLCEGVTERKIYLDYILDHYSKTPMKNVSHSSVLFCEWELIRFSLWM